MIESESKIVSKPILDRSQPVQTGLDRSQLVRTGLKTFQTGLDFFLFLVEIIMGYYPCIWSIYGKNPSPISSIFFDVLYTKKQEHTNIEHHVRTWKVHTYFIHVWWPIILHYWVAIARWIRKQISCYTRDKNFNGCAVVQWRYPDQRWLQLGDVSGHSKQELGEANPTGTQFICSRMAAAQGSAILHFHEQKPQLKWDNIP